MYKYCPFFSAYLCLVTIIVTFSACSNEELNTISSYETVKDKSVEQIKESYDLSKHKFEKSYNNLNQLLSSPNKEEILTKFECQQIENALSLYSRTDIETVLENYNINPTIYKACNYYRENIEQKDIFKLLAINFPTLKQNDWEMAFDMYNCGMLINNSIIKTRSMSTSCAVSVGGAVISCMSALAIANVAGLCWWLATYSASLASVIASC